MTRRRVRWRRTARSDLLDLARWVAQGNPDAAHRLLDAARKAADMLGELPRLGPGGRFRTRGLSRIRIWPIRGFEQILIIYVAERAGSDVLRVVHGARGWTPSTSMAGYGGARAVSAPAAPMCERCFA